jgi:hypothetical protein
MPSQNKNIPPLNSNTVWKDNYSNIKEFKNEDEYQSYIENNIELFCKDVLNLGDYVSHKSKFYIEKKKLFGANSQRPDLYIVGTKKTALVELKYPKNGFAEIRNALSQLLCYSVLAEENGLEYDKLCLVSPVHKIKLFSTFKKFAPFIELYYLTRDYNSKIVLN